MSGRPAVLLVLNSSVSHTPALFNIHYNLALSILASFSPGTTPWVGPKFLIANCEQQAVCKRLCSDTFRTWVRAVYPRHVTEAGIVAQHVRRTRQQALVLSSGRTFDTWNGRNVDVKAINDEKAKITWMTGSLPRKTTGQYNTLSLHRHSRIIPVRQLMIIIFLVAIKTQRFHIVIIFIFLSLLSLSWRLRPAKNNQTLSERTCGTEINAVITTVPYSGKVAWPRTGSSGCMQSLAVETLPGNFSKA